MNRLLLLCTCLFFIAYSNAQPFRYTETIFQNSDTLTNIQYATADFLNNPISLLSDYNIHEGENITENRPLFMDIFTPSGDTLTNRPAIIFAHGGAFLIGSRHNDDMVAMCDSFARRGYVTATMDYRLGMGAKTTRILGILVNLKVTEENGYRATYRAVQDSRAAIRFLKHNAGLYGIDTTKIYLVGSSAGGILSLNNIYLDKTEEIPQDALNTPSLGSLNSVGIQGYGSKANAIASFWGAIENPEIIENNDTPVFLAHGEADDIVPFKKGIPLENIIDPNPAYSLTMPEAYGSYCIDTALTNRNIFHETYFVANKKHEFYGVDTGKFPPEGPNEYWDTIQWKISNFFFERFRPSAYFYFEVNGLTVNLDNSTPDIVTSEWKFDEGIIVTGKNIVHNYPEPGEYKIQLKTCNKNLACDTITKSVSVGTPLFIQSDWKEKIDIYPNPVQSKIHLKGITNRCNASIFDLWGKKLISVKTSFNKTIDVPYLKPGFYILEIEYEGEKIFFKFIKSNSQF